MEHFILISVVGDEGGECACPRFVNCVAKAMRGQLVYSRRLSKVLLFVQEIGFAMLPYAWGLSLLIALHEG